MALIVPRFSTPPFSILGPRALITNTSVRILSHNVAIALSLIRFIALKPHSAYSRQVDVLISDMCGGCAWICTRQWCHATHIWSPRSTRLEPMGNIHSNEPMMWCDRYPPSKYTQVNSRYEYTWDNDGPAVTFIYIVWNKGYQLSTKLSRIFYHRYMIGLYRLSIHTASYNQACTKPLYFLLVITAALLVITATHWFLPAYFLSTA